MSDKMMNFFLLHNYTNVYKILAIAVENNNKDTVSPDAPPQSSISYSKGCSVKQPSRRLLLRSFSGILWQGALSVPFVYSRGEMFTGVTSNLL